MAASRIRTFLVAAAAVDEEAVGAARLDRSAAGRGRDTASTLVKLSMAEGHCGGKARTVAFVFEA